MKAITRVAACAALAAGIGFACCARADQPADIDSAPAAQAIPALTQQLMDAVPAHAEVWQRYLSERASFVDESGEVSGKADLLEAFAPFPPGLSGSIEVRDLKLTEFDDVVVSSFKAHERQTVYDQHIEVDYCVTHTWRREQGLWRLALTHSAVVARDPAALPVNTARFKDYAGIYELSGKRRYQVELRDGNLAGGAQGGALKPLIAVGDNVFADAGSPLGVLRIFVRGRGGKIERMVQRRKFADVDWLRVSAKAPEKNKP